MDALRSRPSALGVYGAAGLLLRHRAPNGVSSLLMQHRSWWSHHGDNLGTAGWSARAR